MADQAKTVLVVDDDPDARDFLTTVLKDNGFVAVTANDGSEAMAMIDRQPPDLVALDITMPEKSGVAVYRKLKEDEQLKSIPVIIVTSSSPGSPTTSSNSSPPAAKSLPRKATSANRSIMKSSCGWCADCSGSTYFGDLVPAYGEKCGPGAYIFWGIADRAPPISALPGGAFSARTD